MEADDDVELTITSTTLPSQRESAASGNASGKDDPEDGKANGPLSSQQQHSQLDKYEAVFLAMQHRILERELGGSEEPRSNFYIVGVVLVLVLLFLCERAEQGQSADDRILFHVTIRGLMAWGIPALILIGIVKNAPPKYFALFCVMAIYWPILIICAYFILVDDFQDRYMECYFVLAGFEVLTLGVFIYENVLYPRLLRSDFLQTNIGVSLFWKMEVVDDWTFEYSHSRFWRGSLCKKRYRCRYHGELQDGLPHGMGTWSDNSHYGEILSGLWDHGKPMAPFQSRQYGGQGNRVTAQRIAFFMATDDPFTKCKTFPTNTHSPRCGVALVETSVGGGFYRHLPKSTLLFGIQTEDSSSKADDVVPESAETIPKSSGTMSIGECLEIADRGKPSSGALQTLRISCDDPRGIQVDGHNYAVTRNPFTKRVQQLVIDVVPLADSKDNGDGDVELMPLVNNTNATDDEESHHFAAEAQFDVKDWTPVKGKDTVVIFIPGFNAWLEASCNTMGQMLGMMDIRSKVHPIIYAFPGATIPTYRGASTISASENNRIYFLQMLQGLKTAGYKNIHIMTHSLGVQTLMSVFEDEISDGKRSPSAVSQCFTTAPKARSNEEQYRTRDSMRDVDKLVCRSITLLHPDYSLHAFREHGFQSIRRVCSLITIVGDRADFALFASMLLNGICNSLKTPKATVYRSKAEDAEKGFHFQKATGRDIDGLYANEEDKDNPNVLKFCRETSIAANLASSANITSFAAGNTHQEHEYLDCDVIDVTGLDANVNDMRHSAFSMNSIVIRDLEELILTGKRASGRSSPLHRTGNIYEYCHAPVFVKPP